MFELHLFFLQLAPPIFHPSYTSTDFNFTMSGWSNFSLGYLIGVVYKSLVSSIQLLCRKRSQCFLTFSDSVAFSILLVLMILGFEREMKKDVDTVNCYTLLDKSNDYYILGLMACADGSVKEHAYVISSNTKKLENKYKNPWEFIWV